MTLFRFIGEIHFLNRIVPVDLCFDTDRLELSQVLADLLGRPDDLETPVEVISRRQPIVPLLEGREINLDDLDREESDARKWAMLANRFPDLFPEEQRAAPGLPAPPKNLKDIQRMLRQEESEPADEGERDLEADLAKLRALPRETLTHRSGLVNKSAVARALNRSKGGGGWSYIDEVAAHYQAELDEADLAAARAELDSEPALKEEAA